jgi:RHS repeat-associated protein
MGQTSTTDGTTPTVLTAGAPDGSYALSGFDNINIFNGNLNFSLPLIQVIGRGDAQYTMMLPIESHWRVIDRSNDIQEIWLPTDFTWYLDKPGYGPGVFLGRSAATNSSGSGTPCVPFSPTGTYNSLTRFTFIAPDGTEYEFRDQATGGQQKVSQCSGPGFNRGTVFVTADGSAATFTSDAEINDQPGTFTRRASGYLRFRNGLQYRIDSLGRVSWMRDRNGNKLSFDYGASGVTTITDSLDRQITIGYADLQTTFYDQINFKGFQGASRTIRVYYSSLQNALRTNRPGDSSNVQTPAALFPELTGSNVDPYNPFKVSSVLLPDGVQQFQFLYNVYGELARVVLPTGGLYEYDFVAGLPGGNADGVYGVPEPAIYRRVSVKRTYRDINTLERKTVFTGGTVDNLDANETLLSREKHYFYGDPTGSSAAGTVAPFNYPEWNHGREYQTEVIDTTNCAPATCATVLRRTVNTWQQGVAVSTWSNAIPNNPRLAETAFTVLDLNPNLISKKTFGYDDSVAFNNQNSVKEYDFGAGVVGPLVRETRTTYVTSSSYTGTTVHLRSLPLDVSIYDGGGIKRAQRTFEYDNYTLDGEDCFHSFHCPLRPRSDISGLDSLFDTGYTTRGNPTASSNYLLTGGATAITSYSQYDVAGNVVRILDPRSTLSNNIAVTIEYDDNFGSPDNEARANSAPTELAGAELKSYGFATSATNATGHRSYVQFDYYLGKPVNSEDANGIVGSTTFNNSLNRPTLLRRGIGTDGENQTIFIYDDANHTVTTTRDKELFQDGALVSKVFYDAFGRTTETRQYEGGPNYIAVKIQYDALGRPYKKSNPFRPLQCESEICESEIWTTNLFEDALGRLTKVTTPDHATVTTSYSGNSTTVTDQTGNQRKSTVDALGRLKNVYEAPDDSNYNYLTTYSYDVLDNLIGVSQGSQTRTFNYDSLSRLTSAINPESGTITYQYDVAGNLLVKSDARGVSAHFDYDALGRIKRQWYNGSSNISSTISNSPALPSSVAQTDEINFYYDAQALPYEPQNYIRGASIGQLVALTYGGASSTTGDYFGYDTIGRNTLKFQRLGTVDYKLTTSYNVADLPTSVIYPSGHSVSYSYNSAARTLNFTGTLGDGTSRNYTTEATYSPFGGLTKEKFGTTPAAIYNKLFYNNRGQLAEIRASTSWTGPTDTTWNRGAIINHYSDACWGACGGSNSTTPMTDNNGNLRKQDVYVPNNEQIPTTDYVLRSQQYNYDKLNRLLWVRETLNSADQWRQWFSYDQYGNRTIDTSPEPEDPHLRTWGAVNNTAFDTFDLASTNRLYAPGDQSLPVQNRRMQYDEVGNLKTDTYTGAGNRTYDAANRMTVAIGGPQATSQLYKYDASGHRIKRTVNGVESWAVYGFGGEMVAEYPVNGAVANPQKEYGYRNGQLLITATVTSGWGSAPELHDNPLVVGETTVQARHITELRDAINGLRSHLGFAAYSWQTSATTNSLLSADPILEMRTALDQALGQPPNGYSAGLTINQLVRAVHIQELRDRVLAAWITGSGVDLRWLVTDQLGTPRMIFDQSGSLANISRHDYLPFGEELFAGVGGRTTAQGYTNSDGLRQHFTQKERDIETGLDYFLARYYSSTQGRFTSPDEPLMDQEEGDPQSWNLYSYVRNNPLRFTDPTGQGRWEEIDGELHWVGDVDGEYDDDLGATWVTVNDNPIGGYWDFGGDQSPVVDQEAAIEATIRQLSNLRFEPPMGGGLRTVGRAAGPTRNLLARFFNWAFKRGGSRTVAGVTRPITGQIFERTLQTSKGPVDILAEVVVEGDKLVLKDIAIYGRGSQPLTGLTREIWAAMSQLKSEARALGFTELQIIGQRALTSTSKNPGHVVNVTIRLQ